MLSAPLRVRPCPLGTLTDGDSPKVFRLCLEFPYPQGVRSVACSFRCAGRVQAAGQNESRETHHAALGRAACTILSLAFRAAWTARLEGRSALGCSRIRAAVWCN